MAKFRWKRHKWAHIEMVENGFVVELFDSEVDMANQNGGEYECPWKEFIAPTMGMKFSAH